MGSPSVGLVLLLPAPCGSWNARVDPALPGLCCQLGPAIHLALLTWESSSIPAPERLVLNICCSFGWDEGFQVGKGLAGAWDGGSRPWIAHTVPSGERSHLAVKGMKLSDFSLSKHFRFFRTFMQPKSNKTLRVIKNKPTCFHWRLFFKSADIFSAAFAIQPFQSHEPINQTNQIIVF